MKARRFCVFGRVQGVSFRFYTRRKAIELGLTGFVRNRADGSVEAVAWGSEEALEGLRSFLRRGSPSAKVENVQEADFEADEIPDSFEIRR